MRVGLLAQSARGDDRIGREIAAKIAYFRDRGADTRLIVASDADFDLRLRANTQRYSRQMPGRLLPWLEKCDLVLVEPADSSPIFDLIPQLSGGKSKIIFTDHGDIDSRELAWFADAVIVHSPSEREQFLADTGYPADRTEQLHDPVDLSWFNPGTTAKPLRSALGIDAHSRLLLMVGRLTPQRRGPFVIEGLAQLPASVHLVFVGESGGSSEPERQRCRERAARHRVADRVHFLGSVDDSDLRDAYRDADMLIAPAGGLAMVEAMACGLPVAEPRNGADTAADLATEIRRTLNSPDESESMRQAGLQRASEFSLGSWRVQFDQLIDRVLESPSTAQMAGRRLDGSHGTSGPNRSVRLDRNSTSVQELSSSGGADRG